MKAPEYEPMDCPVFEVIESTQEIWATGSISYGRFIVGGITENALKRRLNTWTMFYGKDPMKSARGILESYEADGENWVIFVRKPTTDELERIKSANETNPSAP